MGDKYRLYLVRHISTHLLHDLGYLWPPHYVQGGPDTLIFFPVVCILSLWDNQPPGRGQCHQGRTMGKRFIIVCNSILDQNSSHLVSGHFQ